MVDWRNNRETILHPDNERNRKDQMKTIVVVMFFSLTAIGQSKQTGRLIDLNCGAMQITNVAENTYELSIVHSAECIKTSKGSKLGIVMHYENALKMRIQELDEFGQNYKIAQAWRKDLPKMPVYVWIDDNGKIHRME